LTHETKDNIELFVVATPYYTDNPYYIKDGGSAAAANK
jgi:hypothetical protein